MGIAISVRSHREGEGKHTPGGGRRAASTSNRLRATSSCSRCSRAAFIFLFISAIAFSWRLMRSWQRGGRGRGHNHGDTLPLTPELRRWAFTHLIFHLQQEGKG